MNAPAVYAAPADHQWELGDAVVQIAKVLSQLPDDATRLRVLAAACALLGEFELAERLVAVARAGALP